MHVDTNSVMCGLRRERMYESRIPLLFVLVLACDWDCPNIDV
jgi:hypothetical protein